MATLDWNKIGEFFLQLAGIVVSLLIVIYQVGRQHRSSLELQRETLRTEQRLKFFDDLSDKIAVAEAAIVELSLWGFFMPSALHNFLSQSKIPDFRPVPIRYRSAQFLELRKEVDRAISAVIRTVEYREVINPAFVIFRYAITKASESCSLAFNAFNQAILPLIPIDPPADLAAQGVEPRTIKLATDDDVEALRSLGRALHSEYLVLSSYLNDLSRESQNQLLGNLYGQKLPPRKPLKPDLLVIGTSREELSYLEEKLELAKHMHPDALPSRLLYPRPRSLRTRLLKWRRPRWHD